jgi:tetratricopeptide (TPR) repeat protein
LYLRLFDLARRWRVVSIRRVHDEAKVWSLLEEADRLRLEGAVLEAAQVQQRAAELARDLVGRFPVNERLRQGLASVLYTLGAQLCETGDPQDAVAVLDECHDLYAGLRGVPEVDLLVADVRLRRGLAQALRGWGASAIVDGDAAVVAYAITVGTVVEDPRWRDAARILSGHAAISFRFGDPDQAHACADAALMFYLEPRSADGAPDVHGEDFSYLRTAAVITSLRNLIAGDLADGVGYALLAINTLWPEQRPSRLWETLARVDVQLTQGFEVANGADLARELADDLAEQADRWSLWLPERLPGTRLDPPPTLREALATAGIADDDEIMIELAQPTPLWWTPSLRWPPVFPYDLLERLAELAVEVMPHSYPAGLRLALEAHALFAAAEQGRLHPAGPGLTTYGSRWTGLLLYCSIACHNAEDHALAVDLAHWALDVARTLAEQTNDDPTAQGLLHACHAHYQTLAGQAGESAGES